MISHSDAVVGGQGQEDFGFASIRDFNPFFLGPASRAAVRSEQLSRRAAGRPD